MAICLAQKTETFVFNNFEPIEGRDDSGHLFENFIISEFYKYNSYGNFGYNLNFWRTKQGPEVNLALSNEANLN